MNPRKKVSVIIPVKNSARFLPETLSDLINQSLKEIEILAVYDISTDQTLETLLDVQSRDRRVKIIQGDGSGPGGARNTGMCLAEGTYLAFIDSDDRLRQNMLEMMYQEAERTEADICVCPSVEFKSSKKFRMIWDAIDLKQLPVGVRSYEDCPDYFFQAFTGWAWDKLFRKSFCDESDISFGSNYVLEDGRFVLPAMAYAHRIAIMDQPLIFHRRWDESLEAGSGGITKHWSNVVDNILGIQRKLEQKSGLSVLKKSFQNWAINYLLWIYTKITAEERQKLYEVMKRRLFKELGICELSKTDFYNTGDYSLYHYLTEYGTKGLGIALQKSRVERGVYKLRRYGVRRSIRHLMWDDADKIPDRLETGR